MQPEDLIAVEGLSKHFTNNALVNRKELFAVDDVSFAVKRGERLAIVGESGCGKTTLARLILGLYPPTKGRVQVESFGAIHELDRKTMRRYREYTQMIFQDPFAALNPAHTIGAILRRAVKIAEPRANGERCNALVKDLLETVGLRPAEDFAAKHPHQLSGGQRQRVVIARALAVNPSVIVADEPTSMLDVSIGIDVMNLMLDLQLKRELTFILVTHNLGQARYFADRVLVMYAGTIVETGPSDVLLQKPFHPYTSLLLATTPDPHVERPRIKPRGEPPSLWNPAPICRFYDRCPVRMDRCRTALPPMTRVGGAADEHLVRCYHYTDGDTTPKVDGTIFEEKPDENDIRAL